ncbi:uncharacterized protein LOC120358749 [Solenopsis invicta]|uniref:uncharacterized protein LOC120358749 n=1 Tax=Solenopsis invicta TaxID=13686 RepID=UPI00193DF8AD|nr:uncharacterized protein LOC120358749 [Solenopsis invicta]
MLVTLKTPLVFLMPASLPMEPLLLAQLTNKVLKSLTCKIGSVYLWTDSTIVLAWLQSFSRTWTSFVANRVGEIQQLTTIQDWHHVSSKDNPADLLSRGISPASLPQSQLWWSGPSWLNLNKEDWPQFPYSTNHQDIPEAKSVAIATATTEKGFNIFEQFSSLMKLLRVVSYIFRFYNKLKQRIKHTEASHVYSISPNEIAHSIQVLTRLIQQEYFSKELELLAKQQNLNKNSSILRLNPFIDEIGILRVGGRLKFSHLPYDAKHPILLPGRHPFSRLIVIHIRDTSTQALKQHCLLSPKMASTLMGNLPKHRITVPERPFFICGIDYAGPFYIKEGTRKNAKLVKCYMAIFVCFATTAVHIELATDLSIAAFLNVLKRFISRRGHPSDIYSDNGLNFKGACRELTELATVFNDQQNQQQIIGYVSVKGINWHFTPPRAPHQGGLWEAAVKSAKRHLLCITKETNLKYEELETLLVQVEAILNSRPLTALSSDSHDLTPLTPGHFLIGSPLTSYPEPSLERLPVNRLSRWQHVEQLRQHFWKRWLREYLHHCQQ